MTPHELRLADPIRQEAAEVAVRASDDSLSLLPHVELLSRRLRDEDGAHHVHSIHGKEVAESKEARECRAMCRAFADTYDASLALNRIARQGITSETAPDVTMLAEYHRTYAGNATDPAIKTASASIVRFVEENAQQLGLMTRGQAKNIAPRGSHVQAAAESRGNIEQAM